MEIIVCDDQFAIGTMMELYIKRYISKGCEDVFKDAEIFVYVHPDEVLNHAKRKKELRLYILDVDLRCDIDGLTLAKMLSQIDRENTYVILLTGNDAAVNAINKGVQLTYYIMKGGNIEIQTKHALQKFAEDIDENDYLYIGFRKILMDEIIYIEKKQSSHNVLIFTTRKVYELRKSMSEVMKELDERFEMCQRGIAVNIDRIETLHGDQIVFDNGSICKITRTYKENLKKKVYLRNR